METALIDWSRVQFAVTAAYHWLFVPLTLGLSVVMALMETIYVVKGDEFWKKTAKFWMKLFAINFAVGIATGIILEFQFGTNWSNYSWFVGDIFGAPLAIEGVLAFFMEATFFAVMFFGWNKVGKKFHLSATWLTGIGASISAYWILVANGWMQHPTGTEFNMDTVRNEMTSFWAVIGNPVAVVKFFHSIFSGWMTGGAFTLAISSWFLLKKRENRFAIASFCVGAIVTLVGGIVTAISGDVSGLRVAQYQPMKFAATEALMDGSKSAPLTLVPGVEIPSMLSILATHDVDGFVPGINDIVNGYTDNEGNVVPSSQEKIDRGRIAVAALADYTKYKATDKLKAEEAKSLFKENEKYLGYGYVDKVDDLIPNLHVPFWSFRVMIGAGMFVMLYALLALFFVWKKKVKTVKWLHVLGLLTLPAVYIAGQAGWIVAEVGRQPWTIQDLLPVNVAVSSVSVFAVKTTLAAFCIIFTLFLVIEIRIMLKAISKGPQIDENQSNTKLEEV